MADIALNAGSIVPGANAVISRGTAAGSVVAGNAVIANAGGSIQVATTQSAGSAAVIGLAVNAASPGQPVDYQTSGDLAFGSNSGLAPGTVVMLSPTVGGGRIAPTTDLASSHGTAQVTLIGVATSPANLRLAITPAGTVYP
jgi:hypothetical protein